MEGRSIIECNIYKVKVTLFGPFHSRRLNQVKHPASPICLRELQHRQYPSY